MIESTYHDWDFEQQSTGCLTNGFHKYPAMMVPAVIDRLLLELSGNGGLFLDPFCGTGRSLISAQIRGMFTIGIDTNPLAVLISKVKLHPIRSDVLENGHSEILSLYGQSIGEIVPNCLPVADLDFWYSRETIYDLAKLSTAVFALSDDNLVDFFAVILSELARDVSWTRNSEFKLYRMDADRRSRFRPDLIGLFNSKVRRNIAGMNAYLGKLKGRTPKYLVAMGDARQLPECLSNLDVHALDIDHVITSPPYGDSDTTVDYGNFSRLSLMWLSIDKKFSYRWNIDNQEKIVGINRRCLGGDGTVKRIIPNSAKLDQVLSDVADRDASRSRHVGRFYSDLYASIRGCAHVLKPGGNISWLVANRRVKGIEMPTEGIIHEFASEVGLTHIKTVVRNICGKRLPRRINTNSQNVMVSNTMTREYVIMFRKNDLEQFDGSSNVS